MKQTILPLLIFVLTSCQHTQTSRTQLSLVTTDVNQLIAEIDQMPTGEIVYQVEVDNKGNTIDTVSKKLTKYYSNDKIAYSHNVNYDDGEFITEEYLIPNGEYIFLKTSSQKFNYTQTAISELDSTGLIIGQTIHGQSEKDTNSMNLNYHYTFSQLNEKEKLIIRLENDTANVVHHIYFKNNKAVREISIANKDTISINNSVYNNGVITESVRENYFNGHTTRRQKSIYNKVVHNAVAS